MDDVFDPRPGESDADYRERVRQWFVAQPSTEGPTERQGSWIQIADLAGIADVGRYDAPSH
jgi:hypothetical protein